jgi:glycosidase
VYDNEETIAKFTGRNGGSGEGFGVDAALDFPLFFTLPRVAKGMDDVAKVRRVFLERKAQEKELLSSHGEAGRYFVSFLDNHDQHERVQHPDTPPTQVSLSLAMLFTLQGIPSVYYGTEQGLNGTVKPDGSPDLSANESSREALWGMPNAFSTKISAFTHIKALSTLRDSEPPLRYGRLYFREVSGNGQDFGHSSGPGGILAFSRILVSREVLVVGNTGEQEFSGAVVLDRDLNPAGIAMTVAFSNLSTIGTGTVRRVENARFHSDGRVDAATTAVIDVVLAPGEVQVLVPA